jgi:succinoglycan biosynthesis transport protein ExoP
VTKALEIIREPHGDVALSHAPQGRPRSSDRLDLAALLTVLRRRLALFLGIAGAVTALAVLITAMQKPLYTAKSQIVLDMKQEQIAPSTPQDASLAQPDRTDTEVQVLLSRRLADEVALSLHLAEDPTFDPALTPPAGIRASFWKLVGLMPPYVRPDPHSPEIRRQMIDSLQGALQVTRLGETRAVEVSITATSAFYAAQIANEYARQYTGAQLRQKLQEKQVAVKFLASRLDELRAQAQADTQRVQQYRIANNLLSTSGASLTEQEISAYNQAVASAKAQEAEDEARLSTAQSQVRSGSSGDDVGEALSSGVVSGLRAKQAEISGRLADLQSRYGDNHPDVIKAKSELKDVDAQIQAEIGRVISNLQAKRTVSTDRLGSLSTTLSTARGSLQSNNAAMAGLDDLERRAQASQALYDTYLNRYKETVASGGTERADATVVSWADRPLMPSSPKWPLNIVLGVAIGLGAGFAAAFIAEMLFSGLTTGAEVEQQLGLAYLAGVPLTSTLSPRPRTTPEEAVAEPRSAFAEAFRSLRTSLQYIAPRSPQVIAITSALPKEGKTTIAACLARSMALDGQRVIILDCDAVQSGLSRRLCPARRTSGLVELLNGEATFDEVMEVDAFSGAHVLPQASRHRGPPGQIVGDPMFALIDSLKEQYDHIIIDTAPVLPIAETRLITAIADATILVARWRHTPDHAIKAALRLLPPKYVNVVGVVLSKVNMKRQGSYGRGDAAYYYRDYKEYYS